MRILLCTVVASAVMAGSAIAQNSFVIQQPGQPPTYVDRSPTGGYTIKTPGESTQYLDRTHDGSYKLQNPGDPNSTPIYIDRQDRRSSYGR